MTVAIVHYHLGPGGVSQVIATASRVLAESGVTHVILAGGPPDESMADLPVRVVAGLGYGGSALPAGGSLPDALRDAALDALGQAPDVWHFHNHSLGKNPLLADAVARFAEENERLVLQIHDLAEDGRPANYQLISGCGKLYPVSTRIHYAFLNSRDLEIFTRAGLPPEHAGVLPNPILPARAGGAHQCRAPLIFAPVRGIRRKNLGELAFLSALAPEGARFAVSRAPLDAGALPIHETWSRFARRHGLPIGFDVVDRFAPAEGASPGFESWRAQATHFASTSVAEGFGLTFLEAIAHGKPLLGRNLPHLTAEFARHGIRAGDLYDQLLIPAGWVDLTILREHLTTTLERNHRYYQRPLRNETIGAAFEALVHDGWLDFGNLPEPLQQGAIERLADPASRKVPLVRTGDRSRVAEDWLAAAIGNRKPGATPDQLTAYSPDVFRQTITRLYSDLAARPATPVQFVPPAAILAEFLAPRSFHFLCSALKPEVPSFRSFRAVVFDIYGTLLIAPAGGVKPDPAADPVLREILRQFGHEPPESPSTALNAEVMRHHAASGNPFPEIDLRVLWRKVLGLEPDADIAPLVEALEEAWHPARPMPGAAGIVRQLARAGVSLGLLSNAQFNTLKSLGGIADLFAPELCILSYQHGVAKPAPVLFERMTDRLAGRRISPGETLFIGNDPLHDIAPAAAHGFKTALFAGHPDSLRPGACRPDFVIRHWSDLADLGSSKMHGE